MIWKNQFLHLTNGDVSAVYGDSALFFNAHISQSKFYYILTRRFFYV